MAQVAGGRCLDAEAALRYINIRYAALSTIYIPSFVSLYTLYFILFIRLIYFIFFASLFGQNKILGPKQWNFYLSNEKHDNLFKYVIKAVKKLVMK